MQRSLLALAIVVGLLSTPAFADDSKNTGTSEGACCLPDGSCVFVKVDPCTDLGGNWLNDDVPCPTEPDNCFTIGGCCLPNLEGECFIYEFELCVFLRDEVGDWSHYFFPGEDCDDACPGACCLVEGAQLLVCMDVGQVTCQSLGGFFQGNGTVCDNTPCEPFGACCLPDGTCETQFQTDCMDNGGTFEGVGTACADVTCAQPDLACCLPDGSCVTVPADDCTAQGGTPQAFGTVCADVTCPQPALACCLPDGTCITVLATACTAQGGTAQAFGVVCADANCPQPALACCLPSGMCITVTEVNCIAQGGTAQAFGVACADANCPQPALACCLPDGSSIVVLATDCTAQGGTAQAFGVACMDANCPQPTGACCLASGQCVIRTEAECIAQGGMYEGNGTGCSPNPCPQPPALPSLRSNHGQKGSLLIFPKVEMRWTSDGQFLIEDTFISLTNDYPDTVRVLMYFINGDAPLEADGDDRAHPGWNFLDVEITLTGDQPVFWSAATGLGTIPVSPFTALDPGTPPGRPDPEFGGRMLRGTIYAFAVDAQGAQINWNHLSGAATRVLYEGNGAEESGAAAFQVVADVPRGTRVGIPGELRLDGIEYAQAPSHLLYQFAAHGSTSWSTSTVALVHQPELTLQPVSADLRLNSGDNAGPTAVKAQFEVWNENEVKFSGAYRCVTCWDQALVNAYYSWVNHFDVMTLQSDFGKARIDGVASPDCEDSVKDPMLGIGVRYLFDLGHQGPAAAVSNLITTASPLFGMGYEPALVRFDQIIPPQEAPAPEFDLDLLLEVLERDGFAGATSRR